VSKKKDKEKKKKKKRDKSEKGHRELKVKDFHDPQDDLDGGEDIDNVIKQHRNKLIEDDAGSAYGISQKKKQSTLEAA